MERKNSFYYYCFCVRGLIDTMKAIISYFFFLLFFLQQFIDSAHDACLVKYRQATHRGRYPEEGHIYIEFLRRDIYSVTLFIFRAARDSHSSLLSVLTEKVWYEALFLLNRANVISYS